MIIKILTVLIGLAYVYGFVTCQFMYSQYFGIVYYPSSVYLLQGFFSTALVVIISVSATRTIIPSKLQEKQYDLFMTVSTIAMICLTNYSMNISNSIVIFGIVFILSLVFVMMLNQTIRYYLKNLNMVINRPILMGIVGSFIVSCLVAFSFSHFLSYLLPLKVFTLTYLPQPTIQENIINPEPSVNINIVSINDGLIYAFKIMDDGSKVPIIINKDLVADIK